MAYLKQRKKCWYAVWMQNGRRVVKSTKVAVGTANEKKLAQTVADAMQQASLGEVGIDAALDAVRNAAALAGHARRLPSVREYLLAYKPYASDRHVSNYNRAVKLFLNYIGSQAALPLDRLPSEICRNFTEAQVRRVSYGTVDKYLICIKSAFNNAVKDGIIQRSPFMNVSLPKIWKAIARHQPKAQEKLPFTPQEMSRLLTELPYPWKEMVTVSFLSGGQRLGDICCLPWSGVDFETGVLTINPMKTAGKVIRTPMLPYLYDMLKRLHDARDGEEPYVFPSAASMYFSSSSTPSQCFTNILVGMGILEQRTKKATGDRHNVSPKSFHSIRHTVVSMLRSSNQFSADVTREIVGHDSEQIERGYFKASNDVKLLALEHLLRETKKEG